MPFLPLCHVPSTHVVFSPPKLHAAPVFNIAAISCPAGKCMYSTNDTFTRIGGNLRLSAPHLSTLHTNAELSQRSWPKRLANLDARQSNMLPHCLCRHFNASPCAKLVVFKPRQIELLAKNNIFRRFPFKAEILLIWHKKPELTCWFSAECDETAGQKETRQLLALASPIGS